MSRIEHAPPLPHIYHAVSFLVPACAAAGIFNLVAPFLNTSLTRHADTDPAANPSRTMHSGHTSSRMTSPFSNNGLDRPVGVMGVKRGSMPRW